MKPEYRGRRVLREDKGDTAEAGVSQVWCAGTGGASVGQKEKSRERMFGIKKTTLQGERRFMVFSLWPASPLLIHTVKLP
jgi:hypothetical protein